jgi:hypothetical protein
VFCQSIRLGKVALVALDRSVNGTARGAVLGESVHERTPTAEMSVKNVDSRAEGHIIDAIYNRNSAYATP